jgi:hypothetical protein
MQSIPLYHFCILKENYGARVKAKHEPMNGQYSSHNDYFYNNKKKKEFFFLHLFLIKKLFFLLKKLQHTKR